MIIFPDTPWYDGQEFEHTTDKGQKLTGTYDATHETWFFRDYRLATDLVYTDTVYTVSMRPSLEQINTVRAQFDDSVDLPSPGQFTTQQDVNWYLYDLINTMGGSNVWIGVDPPPTDSDGKPIFGFWWDPNEENFYYWSIYTESWEETGLMEFDRPPIVQAEPPARHPKFPNKPLEEGDFWINPTNELYYWNSNEWIQVRDEDDSPVHVGENPPVRVEGNKEGDLWWDSSEEEGVLYVYYKNPDGEDYWIPASPPVSLDGINATIDAALVVQGDLQQRVTAGETAQRTLINKVEALEGAVTDGNWKFTSREIPLQGEFELTDGVGNKVNGNWSLAQFIFFTNPDYLSKNHSFEFLGLEDYIRIGGSGGSAVYKVKSGKVENNNIIEYQIEHVSSNGSVVESVTYDFEFTPGFDPSAYATKSYVDDVADTKVDLAGDNLITTQWRIKTGAKSFISITTNEMKLYNIADPTGHEDHWAANKGYVDTAVSTVAAMPIGSIVFWGGARSRIPDSWVECKGQAAPANVQAITGMSNIPDLNNYMPAGSAGVFGNDIGSYKDSKILSHTHDVSRLEPGSTQGNPDDAGGTSTSRYRYWRGNADSNGSRGVTKSVTSTGAGDDITAPPVYLGVYIMKIA